MRSDKFYGLFENINNLKRNVNSLMILTDSTCMLKTSKKIKENFVGSSFFDVSYLNNNNSSKFCSVYVNDNLYLSLLIVFSKKLEPKVYWDFIDNLLSILSGNPAIIILDTYLGFEYYKSEFHGIRYICSSHTAEAILVDIQIPLQKLEVGAKLTDLSSAFLAYAEFDVTVFLFDDFETNDKSIKYNIASLIKWIESKTNISIDFVFSDANGEQSFINKELLYI